KRLREPTHYSALKSMRGAVLFSDMIRMNVYICFYSCLSFPQGSDCLLASSTDVALSEDFLKKGSAAENRHTASPAMPAQSNNQNPASRLYRTTMSPSEAIAVVL